MLTRRFVWLSLSCVQEPLCKVTETSSRVFFRNAGNIGLGVTLVGVKVKRGSPPLDILINGINGV